MSIVFLFVCNIVIMGYLLLISSRVANLHHRMYVSGETIDSLIKLIEDVIEEMERNHYDNLEK